MRHDPAERLAKARQAAADRGGVCLSDAYEGTRSRMRWRCQKGHEWEALFQNVVGSSSSWCPQCAGAARGQARFSQSIEDLRATARARGGECLSDAYIGARQKYKWRCFAGHEWDGYWSNVQDGHWCGVCAHEAQRKYKRSPALPPSAA